MSLKLSVISVILVIACVSLQEAHFLIVPEDVGTAFAAIYGFSPRLIIGRDNRFGFGFRFGNHADFQVLYELGPQIVTKPLKANTSIRSVSEQRSRRRPFLELLVRAGVLVHSQSDQPRTSNII